MRRRSRQPIRDLLRALVRRRPREQEPGATRPLGGAPEAGDPLPASPTFEPFEMLGRYCITGKIAEGGMGVVWSAVDTTLERDVAIKLLPAAWAGDPRRLDRFRQEAKVLASLSHPHIVVIHAVEEDRGRPYMVMEMLRGRSLRPCIPEYGLPVSQLLDYAIPIADGLAAAHAGGITHRDLKPENVMVTDGGWIKILDFGVAKRRSRHPDDELLSSDAVVGTPPYMSPEQFGAQPVGPPSDVFSLGALLYEMAVGRRPFTGDTVPAIAYAILHSRPPPLSERRPDLPPAFARVVEACLEKDPGRRPATARPVLERLQEVRRERERAALRILAGPPPSETEAAHSIAILPFRDLDPEEDLAYLGTGIAEDVASTLSRAEGFRVIPVSRMDRQLVDSREMARVLGAATFLEGSVGREGRQVSVAARLVRVTDAAELWGDRFDRPAENAFAVRDEVAGAVSRALRLRLVPHRDRRRAAPVPAAYAAYLKGRFFWGKRYEGGLKRALECFEEATSLDAGMPGAHAGRADCFLLLGHYGIVDPGPAYARAREAAERALEIDPEHAEALTSLGWITAFHDWSWERAEELFRRAIEFDPAYATAWEWNGIHLLSRGRTDEAIASLREAQRVDPVSLMISCILGWALDTVRERDESVRVLTNVLEMDPRFVFAHTVLAVVQSLDGRHGEAIVTAERGVTVSGREGLPLAMLAYVYGRAGRIEDGERVLREIERGVPGRWVSPLHIALAHLGAGRLPEALDRLDAGVRARESFFPSMHVDPMFDPLRGTERFGKILRSMNLPPDASSPVR